MGKAKKNDSGATGILLIDKPRGISSHGVVSRARKWLGTRKIGHAGTLDPMATGLLVLGAGKGTKLLTYLVGCDKTYTATIRLGASTPTDDADSQADTFAQPDAARAAFAPHGLEARLDAAMDPLRGDIEQVPSAVSAIKVDGKRSYARVRDGEDVVLKARPVTVSRFAVTAPPRPVTGDGHAYLDVDVVVDCTSGTYIRALARDLGTALGVYGHLVELRRTRVGAFSVDDAQAIPDFDQMEAAEAAAGSADDAGSGAGAKSTTGAESTGPHRRLAAPQLVPLARVAAGVLPVATLDERQALDLAQGKVVRMAGGLAGTDGHGPGAANIPDGGASAASTVPPLVAALWGDQLVAVASLRGDRVKTETGFLTPEQVLEHRA